MFGKRGLEGQNRKKEAQKRGERRKQHVHKPMQDSREGRGLKGDQKGVLMENSRGGDGELVAIIERERKNKQVSTLLEKKTNSKEEKKAPSTRG